MSGLSDEILLAIALFLLHDAKDLIQLEGVNHCWRRVLRSNEELWRKLCTHHWKKCPHYRALALDEAEWSQNHPRWGIDGAPPDLQCDSPSDSPSCKWKKRYQWVERDRIRTAFHSTAELESLSWCRNTTNGGITRCQFRDGTITFTNPAPYTLETIDQEKYQRGWNLFLSDVNGLLPGRQGIRIDGMYGNGPLIVARVESSGEWVIVTHGNWGISTFASCEDECELEYENSIFQRRDESSRRALEALQPQPLQRQQETTRRRYEARQLLEGW
jgi:hypothetical protein